jgi:ABC-type amino acid transport substrate-binding protein
VLPKVSRVSGRAASIAYFSGDTFRQIRQSLGVLLTFLFVVWTSAIQAQAPGRVEKNYPPDIRRILERGELVVAIPKWDLSPFFFAKDGQLHGVDIETAQGLAKALGTKVRFDRVAASFDEVVDVVARGDADLGVAELSRTLPRSLRVRFSEPYLVMHQAMLINRLRLAALTIGKDSEVVIKHFPGVLGVRGKSSYVGSAADYFPDAKVVEYPDWGSAVRAVKSGQIDALYSDELEVKSEMRMDPRNALVLKPVVFTDTRDSIAIAVHPESHQLLSFINLYLAQRPKVLDVETLLKLKRQATP